MDKYKYWLYLSVVELFNIYIMRKLFALLMVAGMFSFVACNQAAEGDAAAEEAST